MKHIKKGQMEIMGLAIVVILIILGVMFVIQFILTDQPKETKKSFTESQIASNMLNTVLRTTSEGCSGASITHLLQDCAAHFPEPSNQIICSNGKRSCSFANDTLFYMFNSTLIYGWGNKSFDFRVTIPPAASPVTLIQHKNGACEGELQQKQQYIHVSDTIGIMSVIIDICD